MKVAAGGPRHVAIVMDGNGRWAQRRHQPRSFGHRAGQKAVRATIEACIRLGVGTLTLFAFSSENWRRPKDEVGALMELFVKALDREVDELHRNGVRIRFVGDLALFEEPLRMRMAAASARTRNNGALVVNVCVNYGGRWDIAQAARRAAVAVSLGELPPSAISEQTLEPYLCLADQPPVDLFIRTGGERRISNFLLWQLAYAELYFTDTLWPDFDGACLQAALEDFTGRQRRYGMTPAQLTREAG
ncbi:MAG TPA: polyprenyl diphosphate synthase [Rhodanobacteraceae bacterium]|nr:polyprenyl diphosphate synthase [Rhodanobacteraceae bacterium]